MSPAEKMFDDYSDETEEQLLDPKKGWFRVETPSETYYTISSAYQTEKFYAGDGSSKPSPKELLEAFNEHDSDSLYYDRETGLLHRNIKKTQDTPMELPPGAYQHIIRPYPEKLVPMELRKDGHVELTDSLGSVHNSFVQFLNKEHIYRDKEMIYKLGVLLYGPPGNGKTSLIRKLLREYTVENSVIIFLTELPSTSFLNRVRQSMVDRMKIFVFEELTEALDRQGMDAVLNFLDGETSMDRSIVVATTNYPEKLPGNLVERPSRFDKLVYCDHPKDSDRRRLLSYFLGREVNAEEVTDTAGLSIAALKEICLMILVEEIEFKAAVKSLKQRSATCKKMFRQSKDEVGF